MSRILSRRKSKMELGGDLGGINRDLNFMRSLNFVKATIPRAR